MYLRDISTNLFESIPLDISIRHYRTGGKLVEELEKREHPPGVYNVRWDGKNSSGESVSSGTYLAVVQYLNTQHTLKLVLLH
jgi:flagellar hook assembly protein FlgD